MYAKPERADVNDFQGFFRQTVWVTIENYNPLVEIGQDKRDLTKINW